MSATPVSTIAGLLLTEYADAIGRQVAEAETALGDLRAGRTSRLSVRCFATAGAHLVAPAVARLRADHPGVQIDLKLTGPDPLPDVRQGRADLAPVVGQPDEDGVRLLHLLDDPYLAVLPAAHPLAARRSIRLTELADETLGRQRVARPLPRRPAHRLCRHPDVAVRPIQGPQPSRAICAAVRETALPQPALEAFVEALREAVAG